LVKNARKHPATKFGLPTGARLVMGSPP
jgi:hypothetical protein